MSQGRRRVVGLHAAESALKHSPEFIVAAWFDRARQDARLVAARDALAKLGVQASPAGKSTLDTMAEGQAHQGIVLELRSRPDLDEDDLTAALAAPVAEQTPFLLVLDQVQDPHNLGACLRTADAAGVQGVVLMRDQAVAVTPTVAKLACGAAETMPIYRVTNLVRTLESVKSQGLWVAGAAGEAEKLAYAADLTVPLALVMGAEGKGLRRLTREHCDFLIRIPMLGQVASLNVSVAAGILMFEVVRQRGITAHSSPRSL